MKRNSRLVLHSMSDGLSVHGRAGKKCFPHHEIEPPNILNVLRSARWHLFGGLVYEASQ